MFFEEFQVPFGFNRNFLSQCLQRLDKCIYIYQEIECLDTFSNTDFIQKLLNQVEKYSISLVEQFNITYDGKESK